MVLYPHPEALKITRAHKMINSFFPMLSSLEINLNRIHYDYLQVLPTSADLPSPRQRGQEVISYFSGSKVLPISIFLPPCPSDVYPLTRSHQLPILQNDRVNNLPTDQTFPSPKLLMGTVKFVIDHRTPAAKTFRKKQFIH
jgi:hypothetical protein